MNWKPIAVSFSFFIAGLPGAQAAGVQRLALQRGGPVAIVRGMKPLSLPLPASKIPRLGAPPAASPAVSGISRQQQAVGRLSEAVSARMDAMKNPSLGGEELSKASGEIASSLNGERGIPSSGGGVVRFVDGSIKRGHGVANPAEFYPRAYDEAVALAKARGKSEGQVRFGWARGEMPMNGREELGFGFYVMDEPGAKAARVVYVSFSRNRAVADTSDMRVYDVPMTTVEQPVSAQLDAPETFVRGSQLTADAARGLARDAIESFGHRARFTMRWTADAATGAVDLMFRLNDHHGHEATVNARTGEVRIVSGERKRGHILGFRKAPAVAKDEIAAAARGAIAYKGMPYSETEYNSVLYPAADKLRERGATKAQVDLFFKLCQDAPIKGGSFNSWSGD